MSKKEKISVKGGKYLEAVAEVKTIVFDKTGTLTKAKPTVVEVISFNNETPDELLRRGRLVWKSIIQKYYRRIRRNLSKMREHPAEGSL